MSKKNTLTAVFVILICILIGGVLLRQYKRANTTECILKGRSPALRIMFSRSCRETQHDRCNLSIH